MLVEGIEDNLHGPFFLAALYLLSANGLVKKILHA
jgi:hypothetical protein